MPSTPNGPSLEKVMKTSNPTNTVGILKRVCMALTSIVLPRKLWKCIRLPVGMKISAAMDVETEDMSSVLPVMLNTSRSPVTMSLIAVRKLSITRSKYHQPLFGLGRQAADPVGFAGLSALSPFQAAPSLRPLSPGGYQEGSPVIVQSIAPY